MSTTSPARSVSQQGSQRAPDFEWDDAPHSPEAGVAAHDQSGRSVPAKPKGGLRGFVRNFTTGRPKDEPPKSAEGMRLTGAESEVQVLLSAKQRAAERSAGSGMDSDSSAFKSPGRQSADRCRHGMLVSDAPMSLNLDAGPAPLAGGYVTGLSVYLKNGERLLPCDSNGLSDPFVRFKLGKIATQKSEVMPKTLSPKWHQEIFLPCPEDCVLPLEAQVFDWDRFGTDFMGGGIVDISRLGLNQSLDVALLLTDPEKKTKKKLASHEDLGVIYFTVKRVRQLESRAKQRSTSSAHAATSPAARIVTVDLIEARDLLAKDANGFSDPYVKLRIGTKTEKSHVEFKTLTPQWRQRFEFTVVDESNILTLTVYDKDPTSQDELMGTLEIDLSSIKSNGEAQWYKLGDDGIDGELRCAVSIEAMFAAQGAIPQDAAEKAKFLAFFSVNVLKAEGLPSADMNGKSDPYCVVELGNLRLRTPTVAKTLNPVWDKELHFPVKDIFSVAEITIYDEDKGGKAEFLGKVAIPLLDIKNCGHPETFVLKNKSLLSRVKNAEITLQLEFHWKLPALKSLISLREQKNLELEEKFKIATLIMQVGRLKSVIFGVVNFFSAINAILTWQYGFFPSFFAMIVWILLCLYMRLWMAPVIFLVVLGWLNMKKRATRSVIKDHRGNEVVYDLDDPVAEDEDDEEKGEKSGFRDQYLKMKIVGRTIQNAIGGVADIAERLKNLVNWTTPIITQIVCLVLVVAAVGLYFVPVNYLLLVAITRKFFKTFLAKYQPFGLGRRPRDHVPVEEVLEVIGRVPSDLDLLRRKRLPTKSIEKKVRSRLAKAGLPGAQSASDL